MTRLLGGVAALGAVLVGAVVISFALQLGLTSDPGAARRTARAAFLSVGIAPGADAGASTPHARTEDARASYWDALATVTHALGPTREPTKARLRELDGVVERLRPEVDAGSPAARSLTRSLLALTRVAQASLRGRSSSSSFGEAVALLRSAVTLDPGNGDAKANLELLLQVQRGRHHEQQGAAGKTKNRHQKQNTSKSASSNPASGSSPGEAGAGY